MTKDSHLLARIEEDVLNEAPLAATLRKCVILGTRAGSKDLVAWATRELKGYDDGSVAPGYRTVGAPLFVDAFTGNAIVTRQRLGIEVFPDFVVETMELTETHTFTEGAGALEALVSHSRSKGYVDLGLPMASHVGNLLDEASGNRFQQITSIYWSVSSASIDGVIDQIRNALTELVANIREGATDKEVLPSAGTIDKALNVAISGDHSTLVIANESSSILSAGHDDPPSRLRRIVGGLAGAASIAGLLLAVAIWQGWL